MPNKTFPNQRMIKIHREPVKADFLGIKNENWQSASRDLGAHALQLYLYLASNANNYTIALSPVAVRQAIGMARSTYHDQFHKLVDKGYLIPSHGNTYEFYEIPQAVTQTKNEMLDVGLTFEDKPTNDNQGDFPEQDVLTEDIEINNTNNGINNVEINNLIIEKPKVKEITIKPPIAEGRKRPHKAQPIKKEEFVF